MARLIKENLESQREIEDRNQQIAALQQTMKAIAPLAGEQAPEPVLDADTPPGGMTDCIRAILEKAVEPMTASELRERLESIGFDMESYSNPLATIHTVLRRLTEAGEIETTHEMPSTRAGTMPLSKNLALEKIMGRPFKIGKYKGFIGVARLRRSRAQERDTQKKDAQQPAGERKRG